MSYSSDTSLELRWIFEGKIPEHVEEWFYKGLDSIGDLEEPPYEDIYLFNPEVGQFENWSSKHRNKTRTKVPS